MAEDPAPLTPALAQQAFLKQALERWSTADTFEQPMRLEAEKDLRFLNLDQWETGDKDNRAIALTIDQIGEPYRQLVGQMRSAKAAIQVNPVDNGADVDTAEVFQGLIRHIEITGHANPARNEAFKGGVGPGWGYYILRTEYEYDDAGGADPQAIMDQCIVHQAVENIFTVFRDPATPLYEPWKCRYAFHIEDVPVEEFKATWPKASATSAEAFAATGLTLQDWYPEGSVRVANYYYVEETDGDTVALLRDGRVVPLSEAPDTQAILQRRVLKKRVVKLAKITGAEILEGNDDLTGGRETPWPYIPIVPIFGEAITVQGKRHLRGIVRAARDAQRMYNYHCSELVYELALAPKSKVIMAEGQDEGYETMWKSAPSEAFPALKYKPRDYNGHLVPPPQPAQFTDSAKIQALVVTINQDKADLRSTTGWYDTTDPNRKNADQSGKAILARKEAQAESAVTYKQNYELGLLFEGMLLLGAIPKVYHRVGRVLRIVGLEDETQTEEVTVGAERKTAKGVQGIFQWGAGRFDVVATIGAAYATRRQEAAETGMSLMEVLAKTHPPAAAAAAPMIIGQMDIPNARQLADAVTRSLPPELREEKDEGQADPEAMAQQLRQAEMKMQEMGQVIQGLQEAVKTDQVKVEADLQKAQMTAQADAQQAQQSDAVKVQIAEMDAALKAALEREKLQVERELAQMKIDADLQLAQMKIDADLEKAKMTAEAAAQARREGFTHEHLEGEAGHRRAMEQESMRPNGEGT